MTVAKVDRSTYRVRKLSLADPDDASDVRALDTSQRLMMMWQVTLQAWMFRWGGMREPRLQRDVVRIVRGRR